jgi:threonine dehydratase
MNDLTFYDKFTKVNAEYGLMRYPSPLEKLDMLNESFYLKRDDLLELGCSKQRSLVLMIDSYVKSGVQKFAVSSSGNAALVSAYVAIHNPGIKELKILLSGHETLGISDYKLSKFIQVLGLSISVGELRKGYIYKNIEFVLSDNPKQQAFLLAQGGYVNLRGSTDDTALEGFQSIGYELAKEIACDAVFIPASSGTTAIGVYRGLLQKLMR